MRTLPDRIRLILLFGGQSAEHDISCISASHVLRAVDPDRYDVIPVGITRDGTWVLSEPGADLAARGPEVSTASVLAPSAGTPSVVMPILHGPNGEDGTVQGLLQLAGVPYVGAGVLASALSMDKAVSKVVLAAHGIPQARWRTIEHGTTFGLPEALDLLDDLGPTVFVKPANMGSSIGVSKVSPATDGPGAAGASLLDAVAEARRYDSTVVVESEVVGRELECAVLGNDQPRASVVGEVVTAADFYSYGDKYFDGTAQTVIPADIGSQDMQRARDLALRAFGILRCAGMARVDMFLDSDGELLVNEVNTIPGFTHISMYPKLWEESGLAYADLIDELVRCALDEHDRRSALETAPS